MYTNNLAWFIFLFFILRLACFRGSKLSFFGGPVFNGL